MDELVLTLKLKADECYRLVFDQVCSPYLGNWKHYYSFSAH